MVWFGAGPQCRPRFELVKELWAAPGTWRRIHATLTIIWLLLIVPSILWWRDSIPWLVGMSVWANVAGHFSAWQGSRAEGNATPDGGDPGPS